MLFYGKTDVGKSRTANQDDFLIKRCSEDVMYAVVCDGMGGAAGGNIASAIAVSEFCAVVDEAEKKAPAFFGMDEEEIRDVLVSAADAANIAVYDKTGEDPSLIGMGTTLVGCILVAGKMYIINIGDSRLYVVRSGIIEQVTHDHSYVQYLVDHGKLTLEEAKKSQNKNIITKAVGTERNTVGDLFDIVLEQGERVILCSDGLTNMMEDSEIAEIMSGNELQSVCENLISLANERGGFDNITTVVVEA